MQAYDQRQNIMHQVTLSVHANFCPGQEEMEWGIVLEFTYFYIHYPIAWNLYFKSV